MKALSIYESQQTRQLRYDIAELRQRLATLEEEIHCFYRAIYAFEREYQNRLGDLADAVLRLRVQLGLVDNHSADTVPTQLIDADYQRLKKAYWQAAKLCHPDQLSADKKWLGVQWFDTLNKAYRQQDIVQVEHILWLLQSGQAFSETPIVITCLELLAQRKALLEALIVQQTDYLAQLKRREDYDVSNRDNWNILLYDYQTQLEDELAMLKHRAKQ